jgi:multiple sugar transport system ATP-binding protein
MTFLIVEHVCKKYGDKTVLHDINFEVNRGEILAVAGPPGAGKTTLLKIIAGLLTPTSGRILLEGRDITNTPPYERNFSMVFEVPPIYPDRTGYENIEFPLRLKKLPVEEIRKRVYDIADLLGIRHILDRKPHTYSGGEYQRVALARALVTSPQILLLDEPLKALDAKIREEMITWLKDLQRRLRVTVIHATHDPLEAMSIGDKVVVLLHGVQKQLSKPSELLNKPLDLEVDEYISIPALNVLKVRIEEVLEESAILSLDHLKIKIPTRISKNYEGKEVYASIRPIDISIFKYEQPGSFKGKVVMSQYMGRNQLVTVNMNGISIRAIADKIFRIERDDVIYLQLKPERIRLYDLNTLKNIM